MSGVMTSRRCFCADIGVVLIKVNCVASILQTYNTASWCLEGPILNNDEL